MSFFPRIRRRKRVKNQKPVLIDIDKLAKREDIEAINRRLQKADKQKLQQRIDRLSPRQKRKLAKIIAEQKGARK